MTLNSNNSSNPSMMSILAQSDASPETTKINPNLVPTFKITHIFASQNNIKNFAEKGNKNVTSLKINHSLATFCNKIKSPNFRQ